MQGFRKTLVLLQQQAAKRQKEMQECETTEDFLGILNLWLTQQVIKGKLKTKAASVAFTQYIRPSVLLKLHLSSCHRMPKKNQLSIAFPYSLCCIASFLTPVT